MNRRLRNALLLLLAIASLAMAFGLLSRVLGRNRLRFHYGVGVLEPQRYQAMASKPGWSKSEVEVAPGVRLNGLVRRPRSPSAPWVLYFPGNDAAQLSVGQAVLERVGGAEDWGLAVYADRGFESSGGTPLLSDLAADAPVILARLREREGLGARPVHLVGFSIGGHLAVRAAAAAQRAGQRATSLALLASVDDIVMVRRALLDRLDPGDDYQTRPFLPDVPGPVLVVQGTADEALAGPGQGRAIAAALGERGRYVELPGVGHVALLDNEQALAEVHAFIAAQEQARGQ